MGGQGFVLLTQPPEERHPRRPPVPAVRPPGDRGLPLHWLCIAPERRNVPKIKRFREWLLHQVEQSKIAPLEAVA